jgi:ABC-2 type transport system ATP-binding protein
MHTMETAGLNQRTFAGSAHPESAVQIQGLAKSYGRTSVVEGVTFRVERGSVFGLIGPNGAGKTTLIRMLMGMLTMTSGRAHVLGIDVATNADEVQRKVGYVPESPSIYRWMTVGEVIRFCRAFRDTWSDEVCDGMLDRFELDPRKKVRQLSKGMQTKLSLLLALAYEPEVLILDEPTTGLDPVTREEFLEPVLGAVCGRGCTVLFSSHTIEDVERLADRVGILIRGRLIVEDSVKELLSRTKRVRAILSDGSLPRAAPPGTVWQHVDRREWLLTVTDFTDETLAELQKGNAIDRLDFGDLSLAALFKDYVKGHKVVR